MSIHFIFFIILLNFRGENCIFFTIAISYSFLLFHFLSFNPGIPMENTFCASTHPPEDFISWKVIGFGASQ